MVQSGKAGLLRTQFVLGSLHQGKDKIRSNKISYVFHIDVDSQMILVQLRPVTQSKSFRDNC